MNVHRCFLALALGPLLAVLALLGVSPQAAGDDSERHDDQYYLDPLNDYAGTGPGVLVVDGLTGRPVPGCEFVVNGLTCGVTDSEGMARWWSAVPAGEGPIALRHRGYNSVELEELAFSLGPVVQLDPRDDTSTVRVECVDDVGAPTPRVTVQVAGPVGGSGAEVIIGVLVEFVMVTGESWIRLPGSDWSVHARGALRDADGVARVPHVSGLWVDAGATARLVFPRPALLRGVFVGRVNGGSSAMDVWLHPHRPDPYGEEIDLANIRSSRKHEVQVDSAGRFELWSEPGLFRVVAPGMESVIVDLPPAGVSAVALRPAERDSE